ncbi:hypothetical protein CW354_01355 [Marinicaulis flavus]|uniref:Uncharacterized protein n=1 Tax=Hyphococcus luteus TaxID=2058213 RepID=A0A2S7KAM9_9PROT|nr:hypothetical protein CW354_01355 [Marinicaulis flavus]
MAFSLLASAGAAGPLAALSRLYWLIGAMRTAISSTGGAVARMHPVNKFNPDQKLMLLFFYEDDPLSEFRLVSI